MATPIKETPEDRNSRRTSVCAVAGSRHARGKIKRYTVPNSRLASAKECSVVPNYLRPSSGSCHDKCKHGMKQEEPSPIMHKRSVFNGKKVTRNVVERRKAMETKRNPLPSKKVGVLKATKREETQNELKTPKGLPTTHVKPKQTRVKSSSAINGRKTEDIKTVKKTGMMSKAANVEKKVSKATQTGSLSKNRNHKHASPLKNQSMMTKTKLKQLIADKIQEKTLQEFEPESTNPLDFESSQSSSNEQVSKVDSYTEEEDRVQSSCDREVLEQECETSNNEEEVQSFCDKEVLEQECKNTNYEEDVQSSCDKEVLEQEYENTNNKEEVQSSCDKEVLEQEFENTNNEEGFISEDDHDMETSEEDHDTTSRKDRMIISEDDDDANTLKFRRGKILEPECEDDELRRLKFRRGTVIEDDSKECSEKVNLKHQEVEKKEAQELLNNIIEETASKLVTDMKTKVGALVGAFETVISLQDDTQSS